MASTYIELPVVSGGGEGGEPSGSAGGDLGGEYPNPTVVGLTIADQAQGDILFYNGSAWVRLAAGTDGHVLTTGGAGANPAWEAGGGSWTAGGDLTGNSSSQTVAKINGATVPVSGALTTGNGLYVSGASALSYGPLNLAGGANYVTGVLPSANVASHTGDVTGAHGATVVEKINGATVPAAGSLTTNHVLKVSGASATSYGYVVNANVDASAAIDGTKVSPNFGSQNISTTGYYTVGSNLPAIGSFRFGSTGGATTFMAFRNVGNTTDLALIGIDANNNITINSTSNAGGVGITSSTSNAFFFGSTGMQFSQALSAGQSKITHVARTTNAATANLEITSQGPSGSATGTNRNPGNLLLTVPAATSGGTEGKVQMNVAGAAHAEIDGTIADGETALLLRRNVGGSYSLQRVSMGAADSGGSGFKVLRVAN